MAYTQIRVNYFFRVLFKIFDNAFVTKTQVQAVIELIGSRIRDARDAKSWSQGGAAKTAKLHPSKYGAVERGDRNYQIDALVRVLTALEIDPLAMFKKGRKPSSTKKEDPIVTRAVEQVREIFESGGEDAVLAALQIGRWHRGLPKRKVPLAAKPVLVDAGSDPKS